MANHYVFPSFAELRDWVTLYDLGLPSKALDQIETDLREGKTNMEDLSRFIINLPVEKTVTEETTIENFEISEKFKQMQEEFGTPEELFEEE